MEDQVIKHQGAARALLTDAPGEGYRQIGWHCIYHEQMGRMCHNPLDCDLIPIWALSVPEAKRRFQDAQLAETK